MKAIQYSRFGGPEVLEVAELPEPHPAPGQIRVAVRAVGINPVDWKMRSGMMGGELPQTTGREVAGVVDEVGEGVTDARPGDRVFGFVADQIARSRGARVIGTASPENRDYLRSLGAEPTAYGDGLSERVRALAPDSVDAALDAAGHGALPALIELTGAPERVVTIADYPGAQETGARFSGGMGSGRAVHALREIEGLIEAGQFTLPVARTFPLEQIGEAHRLSETGHVRGKLVRLIG